VTIGTIVNERRLEAVVVGPGAPGLLRVMFGRDSNKYVTDMIATHLVSIEVEQMEVGASPLNKRLAVAATLRRLQLPAMPGRRDS